MLLRRVASDKGESVAGDLSDMYDPRPYGGPDAAVELLAGEAVHAGVLVGEGGADPRLHVADVPHELLPRLAPPNLLHLLHRLAQPVHRVPDLVQAVLDGRHLPLPQPPELGGPRHEALGGPRPGHADGQSRLGQLPMALPDLVGVGGQGLHAQGGVLGRAALGFDEVGGRRRGFGAGFGGSGGGEGTREGREEEDEEECQRSRHHSRSGRVDRGRKSSHKWMCAKEIGPSSLFINKILKEFKWYLKF